MLALSVDQLTKIQTVTQKKPVNANTATTINTIDQAEK